MDDRPAARPRTARGTLPGETISADTRRVRMTATGHVPSFWDAKTMRRNGRSPDKPARAGDRLGRRVARDGDGNGAG